MRCDTAAGGEVPEGWCGGAEARQGFEGRIRVSQVNKAGRWSRGSSVLGREHGVCKGGDGRASFPECVPLFPWS